MKTISLCMFYKNEFHSIENMINSVKDIVTEFIFVDTGSTDNTDKLIKDLNLKNSRIYRVPGLNHFGDMRTLTAHLGTSEYILMLDADETLETNTTDSLASNLNSLMQFNHDAWAFPRKRWPDLQKTYQLEIEAYPDWQVRFFKNNKNFNFKRALHEYFDGAAVQHTETVIINHYHDVFKFKERLKERYNLYKELSVQAGVNIEGGLPIQEG